MRILVVVLVWGLVAFANDKPVDPKCLAATAEAAKKLGQVPPPRPRYQHNLGGGKEEPALERALTTMSTPWVKKYAKEIGNEIRRLHQEHGKVSAEDIRKTCEDILHNKESVPRSSPIITETVRRVTAWAGAREQNLLTEP